MALSMAPVTNSRVIFKKELDSIETFIEPGKTLICDSSSTIDPDTVLLNGGFLVKVLELSIDLSMPVRACKNKLIRNFTVGKPITGTGVGVVMRSENPAFKPGDHVSGLLPHENYVIVNNALGLGIIKNKFNLPWSTYTGPLGLSGCTAYVGWKEYSHAKKGGTVFVSSGAGPIGCVVIQLAKLEGLKVIASAGSDEKVEFMKECGADVVINYKTGSLRKTLEKEGPIDIYWDNVGGETLDLAIEFANHGGRIIECGMVSGYSSGQFPAIKNLFMTISKSLSINGFLMPVLQPKYHVQFYEEVPKLIAEGKIKYREEVWNGLEQVAEAMLAVQQFANEAKVVVHVADD